MLVTKIVFSFFQEFNQLRFSFLGIQFADRLVLTNTEHYEKILH
jgi:hypothetical protein